MARTLILGGGGFIGTNLAAGLLAAGHGVTVFERPGMKVHSGAAQLDGIGWVEGEFTDAAAVAAALAGHAYVYHLVSTTLPGPSNAAPLFDVHTNVEGSIALLDAARAADVRRIVFLSSGGTVYGIPKTLPIGEEHSLNPVCSYGVTKIAVEKYLHLYHYLYGLPYTVFRLSNPFGPHQRPNTGQGVIATFLDHALRSQPLEIWGDGSVVRDYIYVADAVEAMVRVLDYDGPERVFNLGSGEGHSLNDLVERIAGALGRHPEVNYRPGRAYDVPANYLDIGRVRRALDWSPRHTLADGLALTRTHLESLETAEGPGRAG